MAAVGQQRGERPKHAAHTDANGRLDHAPMFGSPASGSSLGWGVRDEGDDDARWPYRLAVNSPLFVVRS